MLWRVRTTLKDRPGALAELAECCGRRGVNILALQIFPGVDGVTDELVLRTPGGWALHDVATLVEAAGGTRVTVGSCSEQALVDGPTRYLTAVRQVLHRTGTVEEALGRLLDAEPGRPCLTPLQDTLEVMVGERVVSVGRTTPFTATEHARATAFGDVVSELLRLGLAGPDTGRPVPGPPTGEGDASGVVVRAAALGDTAAFLEMHGRCSPATVHAHYGAPLSRIDLRLARRVLVGGSGALVASTGEAVVGFASLGDVVGRTCALTVLVEDGWQRRSLGARLLALAARRAADLGASSVTLRSAAGAEALVPLASAAGLRPRVRRSGDEVLLTASTRSVTPLGPARSGVGSPGQTAGAPAST